VWPSTGRRRHDPGCRRHADAAIKRPCVSTRICRLCLCFLSRIIAHAGSMQRPLFPRLTLWPVDDSGGRLASRPACPRHFHIQRVGAVEACRHSSRVRNNHERRARRQILRESLAIGIPCSNNTSAVDHLTARRHGVLLPPRLAAGSTARHAPIRHPSSRWIPHWLRSYRPRFRWSKSATSIESPSRRVITNDSMNSNCPGRPLAGSIVETGSRAELPIECVFSWRP